MTKSEQALVAHMVAHSYHLQTYQMNWEGSDESAQRFRRDMEDKHRELTEEVLLERARAEVYQPLLEAFTAYQLVRIDTRANFDVSQVEERSRINAAARSLWDKAQDELEARFGREQLAAAKVMLWKRSEYPKHVPRTESVAQA